VADNFSPGAAAPSSGIYKVTHAQQHAGIHYVTVLFGEIFPACLQCSELVRFELAHSAVHVNAHPQFMRSL